MDLCSQLMCSLDRRRSFDESAPPCRDRSRHQDVVTVRNGVPRSKEVRTLFAPTPGGAAKAHESVERVPNSPKPNAARAREGFRVNVKARDAKLFDPIGDPTAAAGGSWCLVGVGASSGGQFSTWARVWSLGVDVRLTRAQNSTLERRRARRRGHDPRSARRACKIVTADATRARVDAHALQRGGARRCGMGRVSRKSAFPLCEVAVHALRSVQGERVGW